MTKHSIKEYEALRAVILTGTTTAAGKRLRTSQSAISRSIAQLEDKTGQILFERRAGRITPTAEAIELNNKLDPLFETLSRIDRRSWLSPQEETLRIGATPTFAHRFLQGLIPPFLSMNKDCRISFEICPSDTLASSIAERRLDLGIADKPYDHAGVDLSPFCLSRSMCFIPADHPLAQKDLITPEDLDGVSYIALIRRLSTRNVIDQIFRSAGVEPSIRIETATAVTAVEFVREGLGVTLLNPFPIAASLDSSVVLRPFEPAIDYEAAFITPVSAPLKAATRAFQRHVRMNCSKFPFSQSC